MSTEVLQSPQVNIMVNNVRLEFLVDMTGHTQASNYGKMLGKLDLLYVLAKPKKRKLLFKSLKRCQLVPISNFG